MSDFLAITGPTTSGKTALSLRVAEVLDGEIISMDSRQVYRGMDIATDKLPERERRGIPHYGLDLKDPSEIYSAVEYARNARQWIADIRVRGRVPLLAGGTGFFLRALTDPMFDQPEIDAGRRERLRRHLTSFEQTKLECWARVLDPDRADLAAEGGPQRLTRTVEVPLLTGRPLSWWHEYGAPEAEPMEGVVVLLDLPREELDERIDARIARMLKAGLVLEVERLIAAGYGSDDPGMTGTGYREIGRYLAGACTLEEALEDMSRATKRYARRQMTWFRHQLPDDVVRVGGVQAIEEQVEIVVAAWRGTMENTVPAAGDGA
ncbi:MAG: tRNA (adenosine(37)-N6)-dimethylallyltransferase MiaA [Gemmatimonadota bacterium]|nr:MAG: tRNA (adenosine(37)-N6)-dimethylallyltransferase MiaA [Gemmatimonadota bacterium]